MKTIITKGKSIRVFPDHPESPVKSESIHIDSTGRYYTVVGGAAYRIKTTAVQIGRRWTAKREIAACIGPASLVL